MQNASGNRLPKAIMRDIVHHLASKVKTKKSIKLSKSTLKDISIIANYQGIEPSKLTAEILFAFESSMNAHIQKEKKEVMDTLMSFYIVGRISDAEFKRITGKDAPKSLVAEREQRKVDSVRYMKNTKEALSISF